GKEFEVPEEAEVPATPDEVWEAIATGPGIDSWFLGRNRVGAGEVTTDFPGIPPTQVEVWDPPHRLVHTSGKGEDGRFIAYEYLVEGKGRSTTIARVISSGFIPGSDWQAAFAAMGTGGELFFRALVEYLTHSRRRHATPVTVFGPVLDPSEVWARFLTAAEVDREPRPGDRL